MPDSCLDCTERTDRVLCGLDRNVLEAFEGIKSNQSFPRGTLLFREGQNGSGVFLLCRGRVRLTVCSESGRRMSLRVANAGDLLGMSAAVSGGKYEVTAEALDDVEVAYVRRKELLRFLHEHPAVCLQVVNLLSDDLHVAYDRVRAVGLGRTRHPRLAPPH